MQLFTAFWDQLGSVLHSFRQHKARAFLTLLGMIIGAGSVVLLSGLLKGGEEALSLANQFIDENDVIEVETGEAPPRQRDRTQKPLDHADQQRLDQSPSAGGPAEGELMDWNRYAYFGNDKKRVMVLGASERALQMYRVQLKLGRFIDPTDLLRRSRVCVIGFEVWQELLGAPTDLTGKSVRINNVRWEVVGVLEHKAALMAGPGTWMWDRRIVVPETTFQGVIRNSRKVDTIYIRVLPTLSEITSQVIRARAAIRAELLERHYGVENFRIDSDKDGKQQADVIFLVINVLMLCTAALSLFVGGINIMNIMLVTVTERTREIGIRRALGATRGDIMLQFLLEAGLIAGLGGLLGVLSGVSLVFLVTQILKSVLGNWTAHYQSWAIILGLLSSSVTGIVFGLYPAWRAARLDPVEALRYE